MCESLDRSEPLDREAASEFGGVCLPYFRTAAGRGSGNDQSTVGPGQAIVPEHDKLLAHTFNLDFAPATPDAVGLDRQQFPITWRLGDVACNRQIGAVEIADDLAALVDQAGFGQKNRLPDDRLAVPSDLSTSSRLCNAFSACSRRVPPH